MSDENKKKGNKLVIILLITLIVGLFGGAGFFGYYYFVKGKAPTETSTQGKEAKVEEKTVAMEEFILNLADTDSTVYLKTKMFIAFPEKTKGLEEEINKKMPEIRDIVNTSLRLKTSKEFEGEGLENVRKALIDQINSVLQAGQITNIYFHEIITQ
jgi:flagellar protein FliL